MGKHSGKGSGWVGQLALLLLLFVCLMCWIFYGAFGNLSASDWRPAVMYMHDIFDIPLFLNALFVIVLIVLFCLLVGRRHDSGNELLKVFFFPMVIIWIAGFGTYTWIHSAASQQYTVSENILKSIVDSFKLFLFEYNEDAMGNMDLGAPGELMGNDVLAKGILMALCILASICTSLLIISLFAHRLSAFVKLKFHHVYGRNNHLYVFWGISESAVLLARSIREQYRTREDRKKPFIIFVDNPSDDNADDGSLLGKIKDVCAQSNSLLEGNENLGDYCVADCKLSAIDTNLLVDDDVFSYVNLRVIKRRIRCLKLFSDSQLHIFFLGDNENENICSASVLRNDSTLRSFSASGGKPIIYCHARHDSVNRALEDAVLGTDVEVKVIDSAYLAIEQLKRVGKWHPVNFVDVSTENPGTVKSGFTALVVGFGQAGRDAVKFLYEFGAFVDSASTDAAVKRSPFECHVVDSKMGEIEGRFRASVPNVDVCHSESECSPSNPAHVILHDVDYRSEHFYEKVLAPIAKDLNYVVLTAGDDETNMTIAVDILQYVYNKGNNLGRLHIFIRSYRDSDFTHMNEVARYYNGIMGMKKDEEIISVFGRKEEIYRYDMIVADEHVEKAKMFYDVYNKTLGETSIFMSSGTWEERRGVELGSWCRKVVDSESPITEDIETEADLIDSLGIKIGIGKKKNFGGKLYKNIQKLRRKESQDMSNSLHAFTKVILAERVLRRLHVETGIKVTVNDLGQMLPDGEKAGIRYDWKYKRFNKYTLAYLNYLLLNLARFEHIRWNAAHEMMGYVPGAKSDTSCNEIRKTHNCLIPWEELDAATDLARGDSWDEYLEFSDEYFKKYNLDPNKDGRTVKVRVRNSLDYKKYDYNVVITSFRLHVKEQKNV